MKKAVIVSGAQQFLVAEGDQIAVDRLAVADADQIKFTPLLVIDDSKTEVGQPAVDGATVVAQVINPVVRQPKIVAIRFRAKKRIHKRRGQRPEQTTLRITQIDLTTAKPKPRATESKPVEAIGGQEAKN